MTRNESTCIRFAALGALALGASACAPVAAQEARGDLNLTAGAAASAQDQMRREKGLVQAVSGDIKFDVNNLKEVEAWFDQARPVSFD